MKSFNLKHQGLRKDIVFWKAVVILIEDRTKEIWQDSNKPKFCILETFIIHYVQNCFNRF